MAVDARKAWRLGLGYALAVAALLFAARYLGVQGPQFWRALQAIAPERLALAFVLFASSLAINAGSFALANRAFGARARGSLLVGVWLATLLAKYVPIGVGHVLGRGLLLARFGVPARTTVIVGVVEQGFSLAICAAIALAAYALDRSFGVGAWALAALAIALAATLALWILRSKAQARLAPLTVSLLGYALAMAPYAGAYWLLVEPADALKFVQALFAGTVAGVLAVLAPGGLGVRESVVASMSDAAAASAVLAGTIAARALILASECAGTLAGQALVRRAGGRP